MGKIKGFIIKAGTILFLACVVMWFLSGYGFVNGSFGAVEDPGNSLLAVIGGAIAPIFAPLGFDNWKLLQLLYQDSQQKSLSYQQWVYLQT